MTEHNDALPPMAEGLIGISDGQRTAMMPLTPTQAWELVTELVVRLDILGALPVARKLWEAGNG